jgi:hypothetical protein
MKVEKKKGDWIEKEEIKQLRCLLYKLPSLLG